MNGVELAQLEEELNKFIKKSIKLPAGINVSQRKYLQNL